MNNFLSITGGSAPGTLAPQDWKKWFKTAVYLVGSAMVVGGLNAVMHLLAGIDFTHLVLTLPVVGIQINGGMIGLALTNGVAYLIELMVKDSRKS